MKEFIERAALLNEFCRDNCERQYDGTCHNCRMTDTIADFPAADVAPVRHGRWMTTDAYPHHLYCSVCYKTYAKNAKWANELDLPTNYCPNCGARMDGDGNDKP